MSEVETLDQIGIRHGTDKNSTQNNFLQFYAAFLEHIRERQVKVLEIGVLNGGSVRTWRDYFRHGTVIGVDINPSTKQLAEARISIEIADQSKAQDLARLAQLGPFDLILDDGSHIWAHQILTFEYLFEALAPGGLYVLEDLDTSYGKYIADYRGDGGPSAAQYLQQLSDWVVGCRVLDPTTQPKNRVSAIWPLVEFVAFSRGTSVIKRRHA